MKQVIQNYRTEVLELIDAPMPVCSEDTLIVENVNLSGGICTILLKNLSKMLQFLRRIWLRRNQWLEKH